MPIPQSDFSLFSTWLLFYASICPSPAAPPALAAEPAGREDGRGGGGGPDRAVPAVLVEILRQSSGAVLHCDN